MVDEIKIETPPEFEETPEQIALGEIQMQDDAEQVIIKDLSPEKNPFGSMIKVEEIRSKKAGKKIIRTRTYDDFIREGKVVGKRQKSMTEKVEVF